MPNLLLSGSLLGLRISAQKYDCAAAAVTQCGGANLEDDLAPYLMETGPIFFVIAITCYYK